jgi:hypothetical protein
MVMGPDGAETKNDFAGDGQQQFTGLDWTGSQSRLMSPFGLGTKNHRAGEGQQQFISQSNTRARRKFRRQRLRGEMVRTDFMGRYSDSSSRMRTSKKKIYAYL